jgi:hypothetical protein
VQTFDFDGTCPNCRRGEMVYCDRFFEHNFATSRPGDGTTPLSQDGEPIHGTFFGQSSFATHAGSTTRWRRRDSLACYGRPWRSWHPAVPAGSSAPLRSARTSVWTSTTC